MDVKYRMAVSSPIRNVLSWSINGIPGCFIGFEPDTEERRVVLLKPSEMLDGLDPTCDLLPYEAEWEWFLDFATIETCHSFYQYHIISQILMKFDVEVIVELGTLRGALALYLGVCGIVKDIPVFTYDYEPHHSEPYHKAFERMGILYRPIDYIKDMDTVLEDIGNRRAYLICDGEESHKKEEFNLYAPKLKPGSVISIHDWGREAQTEDLNLEGLRAFGKRDWYRHSVQFATFVKE